MPDNTMLLKGRVVLAPSHSSSRAAKAYRPTQTPTVQLMIYHDMRRRRTYPIDFLNPVIHFLTAFDISRDIFLSDTSQVNFVSAPYSIKKQYTDRSSLTPYPTT